MNLSGLDFGLLFIFKICVEKKSFSKASEFLNVKQPAVSYSIKKLEKLLNVQLFERGNYGIVLTEEGKVLYEYINEANNNILSGLSIIEELKSKDIKKIRIGLPVGIAVSFLPNALLEFRKLFPKVEVEIASSTEEIMLKDLKEKNLDIVVFNTSRNNSIPGIKIRKIKNNSIVLASNAEYKEMFESGDEELLKKIPIISPDNNTNLGKLLDYDYDIEREYAVISCHSSIIAKELIMNGIGIGFINKQIIINEINTEKIFVLSKDSNVNNYSIDIATQEKNNNIAIREFEKIFVKSVVNFNEDSKM